MSPTVPGLITVAGLLSAGFYLSGHDKRILETFACFFLTFCSVNTAVHAGVDQELSLIMYGIPAILSMIRTLYLFRDHHCPPIIIFSAIYLLNILGEWLEVDYYKVVAGIDILDMLVWTQLGLLVHLAHKPPVEIQDGRSSTVSS